jgi:hypothetical protein
VLSHTWCVPHRSTQSPVKEGRWANTLNTRGTAEVRAGLNALPEHSSQVSGLCATAKEPAENVLSCIALTGCLPTVLCRAPFVLKTLPQVQLLLRLGEGAAGVIGRQGIVFGT